MKAKQVNEGNGNWGVDYNGKRVMTQESYQITNNLADAINHPEHWEPTEVYEIADSIRAANNAA